MRYKKLEECEKHVSTGEDVYVWRRDKKSKELVRVLVKMHICKECGRPYAE